LLLLIVNYCITNTKLAYIWDKLHVGLSIKFIYFPWYL
jgi:hypothetical protein